MSEYKVVIGWSEADSLFIAEAPELPGCLAHGSTEAEALKNINAAIELWLTLARALGDPIPAPQQQ